MRLGAEQPFTRRLSILFQAYRTDNRAVNTEHAPFPSSRSQDHHRIPSPKATFSPGQATVAGAQPEGQNLRRWQNSLSSERGRG